MFIFILFSDEWHSRLYLKQYLLRQRVNGTVYGGHAHSLFYTPHYDADTSL